MKNIHVDDPIYKIYPDYPVLILENFEWSETAAKDSLHFHYYLEIGQCTKGNGNIITKRDEYPYGEGDISIISPNYLHATRSSVKENKVGWNYLFIDVNHLLKFFHFTEKRNRDHLSEINSLGIRIIDSKRNERLTRILKEIYLLNNEKEGMYKMQIITCLLQLLMEISSINGKIPVPKDVRREEILVLPAVDYIYSHYMEQIKIKKLAEMCHFSESHFRKVFQKAKGLTPLEYLNSIRIRAAAKQLLHTNLSIHIIAERCGYQSVHPAICQASFPFVL